MISNSNREAGPNPISEVRRRIHRVRDSQRLAAEMLAQGVENRFTLSRQTPNGRIEVSGIDPDQFNAGVTKIVRALEQDRAALSRQTRVERVVEDIRTAVIFFRKMIK